MRPLLLLLLAAVVAAAEPVPWPGTSVVFQYAVPVAKADGKPCTAYLWVPPKAQRVRGLLIGGSVLAEGAIVAHPAVRAACAEADLGIVLFTPHIDSVFDATASAGPLSKALADLAAASGLPEIAEAPLLPVGHSVATIWVRNVLFWQPGRCLGGIFFKGGFGIPDGRSLADLAGIPLLHIQGRFEEFGPGPNGVLRKDQGEDRTTGARTAMAQLTAFRAQEARFLMGLLVEDGSTHFALGDAVAAHIGRFIAAAARLRRPQADGPLVAVDPAAGVLTADGDVFTPGARGAGFWHPDAACAASADAAHAAGARRAQFISFADKDGRPIAVAHDMRLKLAPVWTGADTVAPKTAFWSKAPDLYPAVAEVGHADTPSRVRIFAGPLEEAGPGVFRVTMDRRLGERAFLLAEHPGDAVWRPAEQPGNLRVPARLDQGEAQTLDVPEIGEVAADALPLVLQGTSDRGLPVRFHVDHGPARVVDGRLVLADVPERATWPLTIQVVAWQYGSAVEPRVQTATPVLRTVRITR